MPVLGYGLLFSIGGAATTSRYFQLRAQFLKIGNGCPSCQFARMIAPDLLDAACGRPGLTFVVSGRSDPCAYWPIAARLKGICR